MPTKTTDKTFAKLRAAAKAAKLPEVEASTSHGKSALKLAHAGAETADRQPGGDVALAHRRARARPH